MIPKTIRSRVLLAVCSKPGRSAQTIANELNENASSVSSLLYRFVQEGLLFREYGKGPRGGFGYFPRWPAMLEMSEFLSVSMTDAEKTSVWDILMGPDEY